jgi:hypothetical protein
MSRICKFCQVKCQQDKVVSSIFNCQTCNIDYIYNNPANDELDSQIYRIHNDKYVLVLMDLKQNRTFIRNNPNKSMINAAEAYPNTHPKDIIALADRLINLLVFL